jgi:copper chaperone CopZ
MNNVSPHIVKTIPIVGMHCASCARLIEKKLQKVPGVINASVNYGNEQAFLQIEKSTQDRDLERVIKEAGYKVGVNVEEEKKKELQSLKLKVIVSKTIETRIM